MPRRTTLAQRQRRFLIPFITISLPPLAVMIALRFYEDAICDFLAVKAPKAACDVIPNSVPYLLAAIALIGVLVSCYRFYRDHILGDAYYSRF